MPDEDRSGTTEAETRARLLSAAERLFADRGFKDVTVREICRDARANVAAVNYHFRDKLGLYRAVLQSAIDRMRETTDAAREAGKGRPAEEQLRTYISIFTSRLLADPRGTVHRLVTREMMNPTPALDAIAQQAVRPRMEYLSEVIADLIGSDPADPASCARWRASGRNRWRTWRIRLPSDSAHPSRRRPATSTRLPSTSPTSR